jgi:hypothetical protein
MRFQTIGLTGMIMGSGRVNQLSGQVWIQFLNKKFFSFSNLFCKLQINLNSNQI